MTFDEHDARRSYRRPSWVIITTAPQRELERVCRIDDGFGEALGATRIVPGNGVIAAYEPEQGAQGSERDYARTLSAANPGRHYAIRLANVGNDPDYGADACEAFENGASVGTLKARPTDLLAHFGLEIPNVERTTPRADVLDLWPLAPKALPGEPRILRITVREWQHMIMTAPHDIADMFVGPDDDAFEDFAALLGSAEPEDRLLAAHVLGYASAAHLPAIRAARICEHQPRVRAKLADTEERLAEKSER